MVLREPESERCRPLVKYGSLMFPLELTAESLEEALRLTTRFVRDEVDSLAEQPSADVLGAEDLARTFIEALPEGPHALPEVLDRLRPATRKSFNPAGPGYLAFFPGGGIMAAAIADFIAVSANRYVGVRPPAPALAQIEETAIAWLGRIMGYPEAAGGILTSGGSLSTLSAIVAARETHLPDDFSKGIASPSNETHSCVPKAARVAGFRDAQIRRVGVASRRRMDVEALARLVEADRALGLRPFLVIANVGSTNTGAIDDIPGILAVGRRHAMWVHADAAYGGFFRLASGGASRRPHRSVPTLAQTKIMQLPNSIEGIVSKSRFKISTYSTYKGASAVLIAIHDHRRLCRVRSRRTGSSVCAHLAPRDHEHARSDASLSTAASLETT